MKKILKFIKSKKADIPTMVLVIAALSLFIYALISFAFSDLKTENEADLQKLLDSAHVKEEQFYFYKNKGYSTQDAVNLIGAKLEGDKVVIEESFTITKGHLWWKKDIELMNLKYEFEIEEKIKTKP